MNLRSKRAVMAALAETVPALAGVTDEYFAHGYGMKGLSMGGTSIDLVQLIHVPKLAYRFTPGHAMQLTEYPGGTGSR